MSILITGGTGSFGQAFVEMLLDQPSPNRICIYSRDEWKQAQMREKFNNDVRLRFFLGDVRDKSRLIEASHGIDVIVHASALKRIEVGHYNPLEMVKTNVNGTANVIHAAAQNKVKKVVALSTDKAYKPRSPYGQTKALAESMILAANNMYGKEGPKFSVTRYGNVSGSTGSVIPIWRQMIKEGRNAVPVTDENCTRFWMRMDEAVRLVQDTIDSMEGGELVIPDWLPAYRLGDLAKAMGVEMDIIGLPKYEKLHEGMRDDLTSDKARRMSVKEIIMELSFV